MKDYIHSKDNEAEQLILVPLFFPRPLFSEDIFLPYFCHPSDEILQYRQNSNKSWNSVLGQVGRQ